MWTVCRRLGRPHTQVQRSETNVGPAGRRRLHLERSKRFWSLPCGSSPDEAHFRLLIESGSSIETVDIRLVDGIANPREPDEDSAGGRQKRLLLALVRHLRSLVDDHTGQVEYHALGRKLLAALVPWKVATDAWCRDASREQMPPLDIIVRHAEILQRNIDTLANHPRRILKRIRERQPIGRLEELDSACLEWYVRQPGRTALEKAGTRQVLLGVARHENFDTLENRDLPRRPKVFFEEWDDPLISGIGWVSELVEIAGGIDIFADRAHRALAKDRIVTAEEVVARSPDLIIGSWCGKKFRPERVDARPGPASIPAVQRGDLYEIKSPLILQPGPAALTDGLAALENIIRRWVEGPERQRCNVNPSSGLTPPARD
jgi:hypothetical protein